MTESAVISAFLATPKLSFTSLHIQLYFTVSTHSTTCNKSLNRLFSVLFAQVKDGGKPNMYTDKDAHDPALCWSSLDPLPLDLQREILRHVQLSARATCTTFRQQHDLECTALRLRWPVRAAASLSSHDAFEVQSLLMRLSHLHTIDAGSCPWNGLSLVTITSRTSLNLQKSHYLKV